MRFQHVRVDKHLSDVFTVDKVLKQGDALRRLFLIYYYNLLLRKTKRIGSV